MVDVDTDSLFLNVLGWSDGVGGLLFGCMVGWLVGLLAGWAGEWAAEGAGAWVIWEWMIWYGDGEDLAMFDCLDMTLQWFEFDSRSV